MERSLFFIRPEAMVHREEIFDAIKRRGLVIIYHDEVRIFKHILKALYSHVRPEVFEKLTKQLWDRQCVVGIVEGEKSIEKLVEIIGHETHPAKCHPGSLRREFGNHAPGMEHENVCHRPKTEEEFLENIKAFGFEHIHRGIPPLQ